MVDPGSPGATRRLRGFLCPRPDRRRGTFTGLSSAPHQSGALTKLAALENEPSWPEAPALLTVEREEIGTTHERPRGERLDDELARAGLGV
jgi:hypothetical protein